MIKDELLDEMSNKTLANLLVGYRETLDRRRLEREILEELIGENVDTINCIKQAQHRKMK